MKSRRSFLVIRLDHNNFIFSVISTHVGVQGSALHIQTAALLVYFKPIAIIAKIENYFHMMINIVQLIRNSSYFFKLVIFLIVTINNENVWRHTFYYTIFLFSINLLDNSDGWILFRISTKIF